MSVLFVLLGGGCLSSCLSCLSVPLLVAGAATPRRAPLTLFWGRVFHDLDGLMCSFPGKLWEFWRHGEVCTLGNTRVF